MSEKKELGRAVLITAPDPRFLTPRQLAHVLQVSPRSIKRRLHDGMPHTRVGGRARFNLDEVLAWLKKR